MRLFVPFLLAALVAGLLSVSGCGEGKPKETVVLFSAHDKLFSEPVALEFQKRTGIEVKLVTDAEQAKTVGLVTRLLSRKEHPEADVFWNNEMGHTLVLQQEGVLEAFRPQAAEGIPAAYRDAGGFWTGFAARARVILYNTDLVKPEDAPRTLEDLAAARFRDQIVIARPLFGTTFTHAAALFEAWGPEKAKAWFRTLKENGVKVAAGNAMARNLVMNGEAAVCLTDTDDANGAFLKGKPVAMVYPDQDGMGTLVIPNSVMLIKGAPNSENGKRLIEFLLSAEVEAMLAKGESAQMPLRPGVDGPGTRFDLSKIKTMNVDWGRISTRFDEVKRFVELELLW